MKIKESENIRRKRYVKNNFLIILLLIAVLISAKKTLINREFFNHSYTGKAIGTFFSIKIAHTPLRSIEFIEWQKDIDLIFEKITQTFSVFKKQSEINILNHQIKHKERVKISKELYYVCKQAKKIYNDTEGYFDVSISPLIELWGFGINHEKNIPSKDLLERALKKTGLHKLKLLKNNVVIKEENIQINLSGIAKGYAVDRIAQFLKSKKCENFMVEVGGEIFCSGLNSKYDKWHVGIESPDLHSIPGSNIIDVIELDDQAIATSGSYRNFFIKDLKRYSHLINPKTGYPVNNGTVSVTVIAKSCLEADAYATGLFIMGAEKGIQLVERMKDLEAYFVIHRKNKFKVIKSNGFKIKQKD